MTQIPALQRPQRPILLPANYNAVKIDINNPQVNAPGYPQPPVEPAYTAPVYNYPQQSLYQMPQQSIYKTEPKAIQPKPIQEVPVTVPPPVIIQQPKAPVAQVSKIETPAQNQESIQSVVPVSVVENAKEESKIEEPKEEVIKKQEEVKEEKAVTPKKIEVTPPEEKSVNKVDLNAFIASLTSPDFEKQAGAMESIAEMVQKDPQKATELLDVRVVDSLLGIMSKDTSNLEGPSANQLAIRAKILNGEKVTDTEMVEASKITPMEKAERNKQYAIYTTAILQKLYGSEIEKLDNTVVPLTELPGAAGIVEQIKNNPNPMIRVAGVDALSYNQRPEYKKDLAVLFAIAKVDKDINVQQAAVKALERLALLPDIQLAETQAAA